MKQSKFTPCSSQGEESTTIHKDISQPTESTSLILPIQCSESVNSCAEWEEMLVARHPDDLSEKERLELEKHIQTCTSCLAIRRQDRVMDKLIRELPFGDSFDSEDLPQLPLTLRRLWEFDAKQKNSPSPNEDSPEDESNGESSNFSLVEATNAKGELVYQLDAQRECGKIGSSDFWIIEFGLLTLMGLVIVSPPYHWMEEVPALVISSLLATTIIVSTTLYCWHTFGSSLARKVKPFQLGKKSKSYQMHTDSVRL